MNDVKKEFFISKLTKEEKTFHNKIMYKVLPEYGSGTITVYKIVQGMYLAWSDFKLKNIVKENTNSNVQGPFIEIDYCLDGNCIWNLNNNRVKNLSKGESVHLGGSRILGNMDFKDTKYKSINIFCYLNEVTNSVEQIYGVSKDRIEKYYEKFCYENKCFITKNTNKIVYILNEIYTHIKCDCVDLIKVKAMELFLLEMYGYNYQKTDNNRYYTNLQIDKVKRIKNIIENNYNKNFTIKDLSKMENINSTDLKRCFKDMFGDSIYSYKKRYRIEKATKLLLETEYKIYEIVEMIGYNDAGQFTKMFKKIKGVTPTEYRQSVV